MYESAFNNGLLAYLHDSPTPFHAVAAAIGILEQAGFVNLPEGDKWNLEPGGRYIITRDGTALIALVMGSQPPATAGIRMLGAHTDSPCLKIKPRPERIRSGSLQLGVEVYGGALLNPWFDRDLSIAGRVTGSTGEGRLMSTLVQVREPVAVIPSLAIHFDREANKNRSVNAETDLPAVLMQSADESVRFADQLLEHIRAVDPVCRMEKVLDFDLFLHDTQPPARVGWQKEFITGPRLDNLVSCYAGTTALCAADGPHTSLVILNNHEEVGSGSITGAQGAFLQSVVERILPDTAQRAMALARSFLISADAAHAVHPNFADKSEQRHAPVINKGPVIKINAGQRYATDSETAARFRHYCALHDVPVQTFVMRADLACGSTIGPLTATRLGVRTVDVGVPIWGMHSIRETGGVRDGIGLYKAVAAHFQVADPFR